MKKLLFSILIVLGLFLVGCGKNKETENISESFDKSKIRLEIQDVDVIENNGEKRIVKQIIIIPADETEEDKIFKEALESKEKLMKIFPDLTEKQAENAFEAIKSQMDAWNTIPENTKRLVNLENSYQNFVKNSKDLREYMTEQQIEKLYKKIELDKIGNADGKINSFNNFLRYPEEFSKSILNK